jgi:hypothetical protein
LDELELLDELLVEPDDFEEEELLDFEDELLLVLLFLEDDRLEYDLCR